MKASSTRLACVLLVVFLAAYPTFGAEAGCAHLLPCIESPTQIPVMSRFTGLEKTAEERLIGWQGETYKPRVGGPEGEDADRLLNLVPEEAAARMGNRSDAPWCVVMRAPRGPMSPCGMCASAWRQSGEVWGGGSPAWEPACSAASSRSMVSALHAPPPVIRPDPRSLLHTTPPPLPDALHAGCRSCLGHHG